MDYEDKRDLAIVGGGGAAGAGIGVAGPLLRRMESRSAARENANEIVEHLRKSGITTRHRIAIVGVGGSGKSEISRALSKKGFTHIPLDGWGDEKAARKARQGFSRGSVIDQAFALHKTGGGHYDAVIKTHSPGPEETRRRLVQRGTGAQKLYNKIDYSEFDKEIQSAFDKLRGERTSLKGGVVAITKAHKAENAAAVPITSSQNVWNKLYGTAKIKNPISRGEIIRGSAEFRGGVGALIGGGAAAGVLGIRRALDNSGRTKAMSSKIDRLINLNSQLDDIVQFKVYYGEPDHPVRDVAAAGAAGAAVGGVGLTGYLAHKAITDKYGTRTPPAHGLLINAPTAQKLSIGETYGAAFKGARENIGLRRQLAKSGAERAYSAVGKKGGGWLSQLLSGTKYGLKSFVRG